MICPSATLIRLTPAKQISKIFFWDVIAGLSAEPKRLPCKYFYDERGSALFDTICDLDEYYLTRTELQIMDRHSAEMARAIGHGATLIEFGSGSSVKTRLLLDHLSDLTEYIPVDISRQHLLATARRLSDRYPRIAVRPVCADFTQAIPLSLLKGSPTRRVVYFPGSTIGNLERTDASALLGRIAKLCGPSGGLLIGIDLQKDAATIEAAYNDTRGVTAQFNLNLLRRINRELDADFDLDQFEHSAFYDPSANRVDIRLKSRREQSVRVGQSVFHFRSGEDIRTEYSHKYTVDEFQEIADAHGFRLQSCWTDDRQYFAALYFDTNGMRAR